MIEKDAIDDRQRERERESSAQMMTREGVRERKRAAAAGAAASAGNDRRVCMRDARRKGDRNERQTERERSSDRVTRRGGDIDDGNSRGGE